VRKAFLVGVESKDSNEKLFRCGRKGGTGQIREPLHSAEHGRNIEREHDDEDEHDSQTWESALKGRTRDRSNLEGSKRYEFLPVHHAICTSAPTAAKWIHVDAIGESRRESRYAASWPE
jgi:hypothetical protein